MKIKAKWKIGENVYNILTEKKSFIYGYKISENEITYLTWDGTEYVEYSEWQIKGEKKKNIGFNLEICTN